MTCALCPRIVHRLPSLRLLLLLRAEGEHAPGIKNETTPSTVHRLSQAESKCIHQQMGGL